MRSDIAYLRGHLRKGKITSAKVKYLSSLPVIKYPLGIDARVKLRNFRNDTLNNNNDAVVPFEDYPFSEFVFQSFLDSVSHMTVEPTDTGVCIELTTYVGKSNTNRAVYSGRALLEFDNSGSMSVETVLVKGLKSIRKAGAGNGLSDDEVVDFIKTDIYTTVGRLNLLLHYSLEKDLYPVLKRKKKSGKSGKKKETEGPSVIYLNVLPEVTVEDDGHSGDHPLPVDSEGRRPHPRKGFWKTLRSERFKNHPLYKVPRAIRVKSSWVGNKSRVVEGNIYTVLLK